MIFRQSHIVLIFRLVLIEILLMFLYLLVRVPKSLILPQFFDLSQNSFLNLLGVIYFILITLFELILAVSVTLNWTNHEYEIREDSIILRKGVLKRQEEIYTLRNLASSKINQDFWGNLFNYGNVIISNPILKKDVILTNVNNPRKIISALERSLTYNKTTPKETIIRKK